MTALQSSESATLFLASPDIYYAAAVLVQGDFLIGRGDKTAILDEILRNGAAYPALKDKLTIL